MSHGSTRTTAPSAFCRGPDFDTWMVAVKAVHVTEPPLKVIAYYLQLSKFSLPRSVLQIPTGSIKDQEHFSKRLNDWAFLNPTSLCDDDEFRIGVLWQLLCFSYSRIMHSTRDHAKEAVRRSGVDETIALAFGFRQECQCIVRMEEAFRLCAVPPGGLRLDTLPTPTHIADTLITSPTFEFTRPQNANLTAFYQQFWGEKTELSLILFAGEFKRDVSDGSKIQLVMTLLTAQHQRRALGMEDRIVLGATYNMGDFVIYSSWWRDDGWLGFYQHPAQRLTDPVAFLQCYSFLCRLHDDVKTLRAEAMSLLPSKREQSLINHIWRAPDKLKSRGGSKGGGSSSMGPFNMLTAESLGHLDGQDLSYKIKKWSRSLGGGVDPIIEIKQVDGPFCDPL